MATHKDRSREERERDAQKEDAERKAKEEGETEKTATVQERITGEPATPVGELPPALQGKPTPTPAEQDAFARGERHVEHEHDGSPESGHGMPVDPRLGRKSPEEEELERAGFKRVNKDAEPERGASYKTRQAHPEKHKED